MEYGTSETPETVPKLPHLISIPLRKDQTIVSRDGRGGVSGVYEEGMEPNAGAW